MYTTAQQQMAAAPAPRGNTRELYLLVWRVARWAEKSTSTTGLVDHPVAQAWAERTCRMLDVAL